MMTHQSGDNKRAFQASSLRELGTLLDLTHGKGSGDWDKGHKTPKDPKGGGGGGGGHTHGNGFGPGHSHGYGLGPGHTHGNSGK